MKVIIILCLSAVLTVNGQSANLFCNLTSPALSKVFGGCEAGSTVDENVQFYLSNQANPVPTQIYLDDKINLNLYDQTKPAVFVVHGWIQNCSATWLTYLSQQWIANADVNIICVDWNCYAKNYALAATNDIGIVGNYTGRMIKYLQNATNLVINTTTMFGHSLGSHVVGIAGQRVFNDTGTKIDRIFATDPAGPCITAPLLNPINFRLDATDANYVQVYHCTAGTLGTTENCGDADVYFNTGMKTQCGCNDVISDYTTEVDAIVKCEPLCSHENCNLYFIYSLIINNKFKAIQLPTIPLFTLQYLNLTSIYCPSNINQFYTLNKSAKSMNIGIYGPRMNGVFTCPTIFQPPHCAPQTSDPNICNTNQNYFNDGSVCGPFSSYLEILGIQ